MKMHALISAMVRHTTFKAALEEMVAVPGWLGAATVETEIVASLASGRKRVTICIKMDDAEAKPAN